MTAKVAGVVHAWEGAVSDPEFNRAHVEAAVVLAPQIAEYLEDIDDVLVVVADAVRRWHSYVELGADDVEPAGLGLPLRQYVDRYADRVEGAGEPEPGRPFDYERYLRRVWHDHLTRLRH